MPDTRIASMRTSNTQMPSRNMKARRSIAIWGAVAVAFALAAGTVSADPPHGGPRGGYDHMDGRFGHNHYYPSRRYEVRDLPRDRVVVGGGRYYYSGGIWYAPRGPRFVVVGPPVGVYVPVL